MKFKGKTIEKMLWNIPHKSIIIIIIATYISTSMHFFYSIQHFDGTEMAKRNPFRSVDTKFIIQIFLLHIQCISNVQWLKLSTSLITWHFIDSNLLLKTRSAHWNVPSLCSPFLVCSVLYPLVLQFTIHNSLLI